MEERYRSRQSLSHVRETIKKEKSLPVIRVIPLGMGVLECIGINGGFLEGRFMAAYCPSQSQKCILYPPCICESGIGRYGPGSFTHRKSVSFK